MNNNILICEISGKRPGDSRNRPTEKIQIRNYDKVIISNDSEGYETDWKIINVPVNFEKWYVEKIKTSEKAWYAPMNRSYAIKYAREHGYRYLVQLDDNIETIRIAYLLNGEIQKRYEVNMQSVNCGEMFEDIVGLMRTVLENTNAAIVGIGLFATVPENKLMAEEYVYSFFMLDTERCPDYYQGDFEDDIEFRLKMKQNGFPSVKLPMFGYRKTSQKATGDVTGCRAEYVRAGIKRGENMTILYGDVYSRGMRNAPNAAGYTEKKDPTFHHKIKPFKLGIMCKNRRQIEEEAKEILKKYARERKDTTRITANGKKITEEELNRGE